MELKRLRVLVVDGEPDNVALLTRILHSTYAVDTANSGPEAVEKLKVAPADLIITDQRMPGMTGAEFLAETAKIVPDAIRIVVTAFSDFDAILDAINVAGASAFLRKPISAGVLEKAIANAVCFKARALEQNQLFLDLRKRNQELEARVKELEAHTKARESKPRRKKSAGT
jgi:adenylate cyclase